MSFLDSLVDIGKSAVNFFTGNSIGANIAKAAITGYTLSKITASINKDNNIDRSTRVDPGVRLQINPNPDQHIPVVYGRATLGGIITDAVLTNSNQTMWYCLTISERTGLTNLGTGSASSYKLHQVFWDDNTVLFESDGITVKALVDREGTVNSDVSGQIKVYFFAGNSTSPKVPETYTNGSLSNATALFPNWTANHTMSDLIFALVRVDYNAEKGVRGLGNIRFDIENSMSQPGDCLYDYMTNTRYGAGIDPAEVFSS
jgi:hypothetical protein